MAIRFGFASLIPHGLEVDSVDDGEGMLVVTARSNAVTASCPLCGAASRRVQSHYVRQPSDLPCVGDHQDVWGARNKEEREADLVCVGARVTQPAYRRLPLSLAGTPDILMVPISASSIPYSPSLPEAAWECGGDDLRSFWIARQASRGQGRDRSPTPARPLQNRPICVTRSPFNCFVRLRRASSRRRRCRFPAALRRIDRYCRRSSARRAWPRAHGRHRCISSDQHGNQPEGASD